MSQGSFNQNIWLLGQKMHAVARKHTDRHTNTDTNVNTEDTLSVFQEYFFQPIIKDRSYNCITKVNQFKVYLQQILTSLPIFGCGHHLPSYQPRALLESYSTRPEAIEVVMGSRTLYVSMSSPLNVRVIGPIRQGRRIAFGIGTAGYGFTGSFRSLMLG